MEDQKIYCGVKELTGQLKNRRFGSMRECADAGKIGRWGQYKVDSRIIQSNGKVKKLNVSLNKARENYQKYLFRLTKLIRDEPFIMKKNDKSEVDKFKKYLNETIDLFKKNYEVYNNVFFKSQGRKITLKKEIAEYLENLNKPKKAEIIIEKKTNIPVNSAAKPANDNNTYCLKCKKFTDDVNPEVVESNGKNMLKSKCNECNGKKSKFIKK